MTLSPQLIEQRQKSAVQCSTSSWQQPSRNTVDILDLASIKPNREYFCFLFNVFKVMSTKHIMIPMTSLMITTVCPHLLYFKEQMQIHHPPPFTRISQTPCPPTFACSSYISAQTFRRLLAGPAISHPAYQDERDRVSRLGFQLLLVNQNSILKIN